ncbi:MAG: sugar ABC transporter substrate-binding protein, partial [Candidatus Heimdallarchaeaceae archaeon]
MKKLMLCILVLFLLLNIAGIQFCLAQGKYTVGLSVPGLDNQWFARCSKFTEYVGDVLNVKVITVSCDYKEEKQLKDIENLIARGVDGVIVLPQTSAIGPAILKVCEQSHVYIQGADRSLGLMPNEWTGRYYVGHIALNDEEGGYKNAKALLEAGCREIVSINHARGASVSESRQEGLLRALKEYP